MKEESKRQRQVAGLINEELNTVFLKLGLGFTEGGIISIANVKVTPDLLEARIYLSFFNLDNPDEAMQHILERQRDIKRELVGRIGKQLRRMPELQFYKDDTLDYVFKMEQLIKKSMGDASADEPEANPEP